MRAGTLVIDIQANLARLQQDMGEAKSVVERGMRDVKSTVEDVKSVFATLGVSLGVGVFANTIKSTIEMEANLVRLAQRTGETVESISSLTGVAKRSGADLDQVAVGMQKLAKSMAESSDGTTKAAKVFDALKVSVADATTGALRPTQEVMQEVAQKLMAMRDQTLAVAFAQEVFGKAGANLLPFLYELASAGKLQAKVTAEQAEAAKRFEDGLKTLQGTFNTTKIALANEMLPTLQRFLDQMVEGTRIAGGFGNALMLFGVRMKPGYTLAEAQKDLAGMESFRKTATPGQMFADHMNHLVGGDIDERIETQKKVVRFLGFQRAQEISAGLQGQHFLEDVIPGPKKNVPNPLGNGGGVNDGSALLLGLQNQLASANGDASVFDSTMRRLTDGTTVYSKATVAAALALAGEIDEIKKANEVAASFARLQMEIFQSRLQWLNQQDSAIASMEAENKRLREQNEEIGLTADQVNRLRQARLDEAIAIQERDLIAQRAGGEGDEEIQRLMRQIELLKQKRDLVSDGAFRQGVADQAKADEEAYKRNFQVVDNALTSAISNGLGRGFRKGESAARNFVHTLEDAFKNAVFTPLIRWVVSPVAGAIAGMLPTGAGAASSLLGGGGGGFNPLSLLNSGSSFMNGGSFGTLFGGGGGTMLAGADGIAGIMGTGVAEEAAALGIAQVAGPGMGMLGPVGLGLGALALLGGGLFGDGGGPKPSGVILQSAGPGKYKIGDMDLPGSEANAPYLRSFDAVLSDPTKYDPSVLDQYKDRWIMGDPGESAQSLVGKLMQQIAPAAQSATLRTQTRESLLASQDPKGYWAGQVSKLQSDLDTSATSLAEWRQAFLNAMDGPLSSDMFSKWQQLGEAITQASNAAGNAASTLSTSGFSTLFEYRRAVRLAGGVPKFAGGGNHAGGWRIVGDGGGPELEYTGPSQILSTAQSQALFDDSGIRADLAAMRQQLNAALVAIARHTSKTASLHDRWDGEGLPVRAPDPTQPISVTLA